MFITTHALIGALIGERLADTPALAFGLGLVSHFLADIIPHGDSNLYKGYVSGSKVKRAVAYVTVDTLVAMLFVMALFNTHLNEHRLAISLGIFGSVLPDLLVAMYQLFRVEKLRGFNKFHFFFHNLITSRKGDIPLSLGVVMQLIVLAFLMVRVW
jgi:hypothetical protein